MKRVFWLPTGRDLWFEIADQLEVEGIATPVFWMGDDALFGRAKRRFPKAEVQSIGSFTKAQRIVPEHMSDPFYLEFILGPEWRLIRDHAFKLMDRADFKGDFSFLERDAFFYQLVSWAKSTLDRLKPDLVFTSEAPHGAAAYVLFAVAQALNIRVLTGVLIPLLPAMYFRDGLDGSAIDVNSMHKKESTFQEDTRAELNAYKTRVLQSYAYVPDYVTKLTKMPLLRRAVYAIKGLTPKRRVGSAKRSMLKTALTRVQTAVPQGDFVYVPLQYEPERTTTPDGGIFYDQIKAILALRAALPKSVSIVVKEHPSMFSAKNYGHLGRHPRHYSVLASLSGVTVVPIETSSVELISKSAAVATVTGTAALEAALLGKPSIVFGSPWFKGLPNTTDFQKMPDWPDFVGRVPETAEVVIDWLVDLICRYGFYGTPNPSGVKLFAKHFADPNFSTLERQSLFGALKGVMTGTPP